MESFQSDAYVFTAVRPKPRPLVHASSNVIVKCYN